MKRTLTLLTALLLLVSLLIPAAAAMENDQSGGSSDTDSDRVTEQATETGSTAIRFYIHPTTIAFSFSDVKSIDDPSFTGRSGNYILAIYDNGSFTFQKRNDMGVFRDFSLTPNSEALQFYISEDLTGYLGSDITIEHKYYFHGEAYGMGTAIYYRTNKGDYVYFNHEQIGNCLFPAEIFCAYQRLVLEMNAMDEEHYNAPTTTLNYKVWPLANYQIDSSLFSPNTKTIPWVPENLFVYLCIGALLLITGIIAVIVVIYRKKIKAHNPYEENQGTEFDPDFVIYHTINDSVDAAENLPLTPN